MIRYITTCLSIVFLMLSSANGQVLKVGGDTLKAEVADTVQGADSLNRMSTKGFKFIREDGEYDAESGEFAGGALYNAEQDYTIPQELCGYPLFVQRFAPFDLKDLSKEELATIHEKDSVEGMSNFLAVHQLYNQLLYRKFNDGLEEFIEEYSRDSGMTTIYMRDFNEIQADSIRFILRPKFSVVDFLAVEKKDRSGTTKKELELAYFIYDKQEDIAYTELESLNAMAGKLKKFDRMCESGKAQESTQADLQTLLDQEEYGEYYYSSSGASGCWDEGCSDIVFSVGFYAVYFALLIAVGAIVDGV